MGFDRKKLIRENIINARTLSEALGVSGKRRFPANGHSGMVLMLLYEVKQHE